jgi:hypothetical protein
MGKGMHVGIDQTVPRRKHQGGDIVDRPPYKRRAIHRARARPEKASGQSAPGQFPIHIDRLISPRVAPDQLNDDALARAVDRLYAYGVTELNSLLAATAAERLGLTAFFAHLDSTSFHVDGRYNSDE